MTIARDGLCTRRCVDGEGSVIFDAGAAAEESLEPVRQEIRPSLIGILRALPDGRRGMSRGRCQRRRECEHQ
jgi:hypothetical protein